MRLRKIVTGILIASTLGLSAPVLADPAPEGAGGAPISTTTWVLALAGLTLAVVGVVDSSKSP